jgi:hypothetical protein
MTMADKGKGKDKGKTKKAPKASKPGVRPHEQRAAVKQFENARRPEPAE